jgi:hypothetical protein
MIRSRRRAVVFPQAEHARLAGTLALAWHERPPLRFESFVRGVADHDRGYGELDNDELGAIETEPWVAIQRRGFALLSSQNDEHELSAFAEVDELIPSLLDAAGASVDEADTADRITNVCDRIALLFCIEEPADGEIRGYAYTLDGVGGITIDPWPLAVPRLVGLVAGYAADGYPERLVPVVTPFDARPR